MFCPQCGSKCKKLWEDLAEQAAYLCESCGGYWNYVPDAFNRPVYVLAEELGNDNDQ